MNTAVYIHGTDQKDMILFSLKYQEGCNKVILSSTEFPEMWHCTVKLQNKWFWTPTKENMQHFDPEKIFA